MSFLRVVYSSVAQAFHHSWSLPDIVSEPAVVLTNECRKSRDTTPAYRELNNNGRLTYSIPLRDEAVGTGSRLFIQREVASRRSRAGISHAKTVQYPNSVGIQIPLPTSLPLQSPIMVKSARNRLTLRVSLTTNSLFRSLQARQGCHRAHRTSGGEEGRCDPAGGRWVEGAAVPSCDRCWH